MTRPARKPARLPRVGDRFVSRGVEWRVYMTTMRTSTKGTFRDFTMYLDRVSRPRARVKE